MNYQRPPQHVRELQMAIAARTEVSEITVHPNEDGNEDLFMFFLTFPDGQEHSFYVLAEHCKSQAFREKTVQSLLPEISH